MRSYLLAAYRVSSATVNFGKPRRVVVVPPPCVIASSRLFSFKLKDLKRQLALEKKRNEKLQEKFKEISNSSKRACSLDKGRDNALEF